MAVIIPSDLIAGVLRAATPKRAEAAKLRLAGLEAADFRTELAAAGQSPPPKTGDFAMDVTPAALARHDNKADAYRKFEAFLLSNAFESILPDADSEAFGEGFAGGIWRSMAAEQFASLFAEQGGIGVAGILAARDGTGEAAKGSARRSAQWPYFQTDAITAFRT